MKKLLIVLTALLTVTVSVNAMSYEQARDQALFLTDKMAYELNLTEDQYEAAFEINLDYLMSVETVDDLYSVYWTRRNLDLSYILLDWQYRAYMEAAYFYRPLYWNAGYWHFGIYARYPHRTYFYFGRPHFYATYRGGHSWIMNGGRSWYHGRTFGVVHRNAHNLRGFGMRNGFDRGDFRNHSGNFARNQGSRGLERVQGGNFSNSRNSSFGNSRGGSRSNNRGGNFGSNRGFNQRESSTRTTVGRQNNFSGSNGRSSSSVSRSSTSHSNVATPNRTFSPNRGSSSASRSSSFGSSSSRSSSFGSSPSRGSSSRSGSSMSSGSHSGGSRSAGNSSSRGGGNFGGRR